MTSDLVHANYAYHHALEFVLVLLPVDRGVCVLFAGEKGHCFVGVMLRRFNAIKTSTTDKQGLIKTPLTVRQRG